MGKRIIQQARGKGSLTYRVKKRAFRYKIGYPKDNGKAKIIALIHSAGHSSPLAKLKINERIFFVPAFEGAYIEQKISVGSPETEIGNIVELKYVPIGTRIYNIERNPGDGGKMIRAAGSSAVVSKKTDGKIVVAFSNKKEATLNEKCRATIGKISGEGKILKPFFKAGARFHKLRAKGKLYPKISAVSVNAVDHPFGSGRGKRIKSKIAKRDSSPGRKVGHLRPRKTGKRK